MNVIIVSKNFSAQANSENTFEYILVKLLFCVRFVEKVIFFKCVRNDKNKISDRIYTIFFLFFQDLDGIPI